MLKYLSISNLAIIDKIEVEFREGLNALTGETGAGKSILIGALDLLLGAKGSADIIRTGEEEAHVEASSSRIRISFFLRIWRLQQRGKRNYFIQENLQVRSVQVLC